MTTTETTRTAHTSAGSATPGRTDIAPRALDRVVSAVSADALGVAADKVGVDLGDDHGSLSVTVSAPIRVPTLARVEQEPGVVERRGGPLLERAKRAQEHIRARVHDLTGRDIARVIVTIIGVDIREERRVR